MAGAGGDGQEKLHRDLLSTPERTKKAGLPKKSALSLGMDTADETPKEKKRKSEGSKEKGSSTKKKRSSKAGLKEA